ncbi:glycosyltransferase family 4 protein [Actinoplanes rectilineatus]|uniref:glycosyltransferase family 4 protein n=1 Tax=Actinoplanes rectilineatus TaxID=113571 RepID=UPI0005F28ABE|nr:glycosyltransferase family 4 protein [Actinoplanes rectilineatus]
MRISFLVHNVYGVGGTNRTVINLATELSRRHEVEIVSILRRLDRPMLDVPDRVTVTGLLDLRSGMPDTKDPRFTEVSRLTPQEEEFFRFYSRLSDERITNYLRRTAYDVVVGTRSALNLAVARLGRPGSVRVAQEHMTQDMIPASVHEEMRRYYGQLSAVTAVTEADAAAVRTLLGPGAPPVLAVPNSVPDPAVAPADSDRRIVIAAGRLDAIKRYDLLVRAFAKVITERPDWTLRIYGSGGQSQPLGTLIADLGLHNHVFRMGGYAPLEAEWVKGSIAAVTSDKESFGMTIVEAMRCGLPVVSTACPVGPAEIIEDGVDGLLVPTGDVDAIAGGLLRLMNDQDLRARMGTAARENARRYDPVPIAAAYESLFTEHLTPGGRRAGGTTGPARRLRSGGRALFRVLPGLRIRGGTAPAPVAGARLDGDRVVVTLPATGLPRGMTRLVARPRRIEGVTKAVRVPLTGDPETGWQASFPAWAATFAEGRWDLYAADRRDGLHRLRAGLLDLRGLIGGPETAPFVRNVPYPTADGYLAVAAWQRPEHAELEHLTFGEEHITVTGRLVGGDFGDTVPTLIMNRRGEHEDAFTVPGVTCGAGRFTVDVPTAAFADRRLLRYEDWDASVARGPDGTPVPVARLMDDVVERKRVYVYTSMLVEDRPEVDLYEEYPRPEVRVRPYLSVPSSLAFAVTDRPG